MATIPVAGIFFLGTGSAGDKWLPLSPFGGHPSSRSLIHQNGTRSGPHRNHRTAAAETPIKEDTCISPPPPGTEGSPLNTGIWMRLNQE